MVELTLTLSKFTYLLSATLTIGFLLAIIFFAKNFHGHIRENHKTLRSKAGIAAWIWAAATVIYIVATLASVLDVSLLEALDFTTLRSFITQISLGKFLAIQLLGAVIVAIWVKRCQRITQATLVLLLALVALSAPIFQSHSASGGSHLMAIGTLLVHVVAITMWVGGLIVI